jgi:manganese/zinc/iron transport system permease protein
MRLEIQLIAALVAAACAIPGVFLVLRKMSLMSDAISHAVLPGIVLGFLLSGSLTSPLLILGAVVMGIITVLITEAISKTELVQNDAAIGIVFPALFSVGVILVAKYTGNVHLDTDAVLLGELAFAPFDRVALGGIDLGPKAAWVMGIILLVNLGFLGLFFKELKLATFDPGLAATLGFSPALVHYALMIDVSITAVGAFDAVGSILVVALMIAPAATAYLITDNLKMMVLLSVGFGVASALLGFWAAWFMDASIAGAMAGMAGVLFLGAFLFAPHRGMLSRIRERRTQKLDFSVSMLAVHLLHHSGQENATTECHVDHLQDHINWERRYARSVVGMAMRNGLIEEHDQILSLTESGVAAAREAMTT